MGGWRTDTDRWLSSEALGDEDAADAAFMQVFAALPSVEPSASFVQRATDAAWAARARRHRIAMTTALAASVAVAVAGAVLAYAAFGAATAPILALGTSVMTAAGVSTLGALATLLDWWLASVHLGSTVTTLVSAPQGAAAVFAMELVGVAALLTLRRLLQAEPRLRGSRTLWVLA